MTPEQLEMRLAALEKAVGELQTQVRGPGAASNWLEHITGSFKDEPAFDDVLRYGREFRQADWPPESDEAEA